MKSIGVGMIGCGTVGMGVWNHLYRNLDMINNRTGVEIHFSKVAVKDLTKKRGKISSDLLTGKWKEVIEDPDSQIVLELVGGTDLALDIASAALCAKKPLVTANKALLAEHGETLAKLSEENHTPIYIEASVAAGVPIIRSLRQGFRANRIQAIHGIINGTCNYILSTMTKEGGSFNDVLAQAKKLGYAEADESLDISGKDAGHKAAILASLAYGFWVQAKDVHTEGISGITELDITFAKKLGYTIKLLSIITSNEDRAVSVRVHPTLVPKRNILSSVSGVYNAIAVEGDIVGHTLFYGKGAGESSTASAVLADLSEAAMDLASKRPRYPLVGTRKLCSGLLPMDEVTTRYYVRLTILDHPGVLAQISSIFGEHSISISSVFQPESRDGEYVPLILLLDYAKESNFQKAIRKVAELPPIRTKPNIIRIGDLPTSAV